MSKLYIGDSNNTSKKPKKSYVGYNGKSVQIMYSEPKVYGVAWDGSAATSFTRLEDAKNFSAPNPYYAGMSETPSSPFDNLYPWCEMKKSENTDAGTVVAIPKFYYKLEYASGTTGLKLWIADKPVSGFKVSPAKMNRGDGAGERDVTYVGRYHCASDYKSKTGVAPKVSTTRSAFRSGIHALGNDIWQWDYPTLEEIWWLYLTEYTDWQSQGKLGGGCSATTSSSSAVYDMGSTDSMPYHSGTVSSSIGRTVYGANQYRYIENLWGNCFDWIDGVYFSAANIYSILNPANFSDTANGTLVGTRPTSSNYISAFGISAASGFEWFLYPSAVSGSESTYVGDYCDYNASGVVLCAGGDYKQSQSRGLFFLYGDNAASSAGAGIGSRLLVLP